MTILNQYEILKNVTPNLVDYYPYGKEYVGYTRLLRRVPRDINTDKVIYEEG